MGNFISISGLTESQVVRAIDIVSHIPRERMPRAGSQAYALLLLLITYGKIESSFVTKLFGCDPRSAIQYLKKSHHWNIKNLSPQGRSAVYVIDSRHLTGGLLDDMAARADSKVAYTKRSLNLSLQEIKRLGSASLKFQAAKDEQMELIFDVQVLVDMSFESTVNIQQEAANDSLSELSEGKEKPSKAKTKEG